MNIKQIDINMEQSSSSDYDRYATNIITNDNEETKADSMVLEYDNDDMINEQNLRDKSDHASTNFDDENKKVDDYASDIEEPLIGQPEQTDDNTYVQPSPKSPRASVMEPKRNVYVPHPGAFNPLTGHVIPSKNHRIRNVKEY